MQGQGIFRYIDLAVLVLALLGTVVIGFVLSRKNKDSDSFFMARESMPGWAVGLSLMATIISSMTFLASPAYSYKADWRWMATCIAYPLALIPAIKWFMPFFRSSEARSAYDYFEQRFGPWARVYVAFGFVLTQGFRSGIILDATAIGLDALVGIPYLLTIIGMGSAVVVYCALGGLKAVIWTDVIQGIGLIAGAALVIPIVCYYLPGGAGQLIRDSISESKISLGPMTSSLQDLTFWTILISHIVLYTQWFCTDQMFVQRYCSPRTMRDARWTLNLSMLTTVPVWTYFIMVGTAVWAFYRQFPDSVVAAATAEEAFPRFVANNFPVGLSGLFATGMCLAAMPSSSINAAAATIETDFYRRFLVKRAPESHYLVAGRVFSVVFGIIVIGIAFVVHSVRTTTLIELQAVMMGIFGSGLLGLFLLGFATRASNQSAAIATLLTIGLVAGWLTLAQSEDAKTWMPHDLWLGVVANVFLFMMGLCWELGRWATRSGIRETAPSILRNDTGSRAGADLAAISDTTPT